MFDICETTKFLLMGIAAALIVALPIAITICF